MLLDWSPVAGLDGVLVGLLSFFALFYYSWWLLWGLGLLRFSAFAVFSGLYDLAGLCFAGLL